MPTLADQFMARFDNVPDGEIRTGIAAHANSTGTAQLERERADAAMKMSYGDTPTFVRNLSEGAIGSAGSTLTALQSTFGRPSDESRGALDNRAASAQRLDPSLMGDITRGVGGLVADLPLMGATAGIGGLGAVGRLGNMGRTAILNAPIAVREGVNTGADKGVSAGLSAGAIEGVIPALFGMRGLEKLFGHAASAAARAGMSKGYIRELAAEAGSQISEEMVGEASHALDEYARGDASALDPTNLGRRLMVAGAVGGVGGSLGGVSHAIHDVIDTATGADQQRSVDELIAQQETAGAGVMSLGGDDPAVMDARKRDPARARMIAAEQGALVKERARQVLVKIAPELANSPDPIVAINTLRNSSDPAIQAKIDEAFGNLGGVKVNIDGQSPEVSSVGQPTTLPGVVANRRGILDSGGTTAEMRMSPQEVSARDESVRADDATRQAELAAKREGADARQKFDSENAPVRRDAEQSLRDLTKLRRSTPLPNRELDALISEQQAVIDEHVAAEADAATRVISSADTAKVNQAATAPASAGQPGAVLSTDVSAPLTNRNDIERAIIAGRKSGESMLSGVGMNRAIDKFNGTGINRHAHGLAKGRELDFLDALLTTGISGAKKLYEAPLWVDKSKRAAMASAMGTSGGTAYNDGPFIVVGKHGTSINQGGIDAVLVNDSIAAIAIPSLQAKYPGVTFIPFSQAATLKQKSAGQPGAEADAATRVISSADTAKVNQAETLKESDGELASIRRERDNAASQVKRSKAADARVVDATANDPAATFEASIAGEPDAIPASERPATVSTPSKQQPIKDTVDPEIIHAAENAVLSKYGFAPNPDSAAASTPLAHDENFKEVLRPLPRPSKDLMAGLAEDARRGNSDAKQALTSIRSYSATKVGWAKEDRNQSSDPKTYRGAEERANVLTEVKAAKADALNRAMNDERQVRQRDRQLNAEQKAAQSPPINASSDPGVTVNTPDLSVEPPVGGVTAVRQARLEGINARLAAAKAKAASLKPTPDAPNVVAARNTLNAESARIDEGRDSPTQATADLLQSAETDAASKLAQLKAERDALRPTKPTPVAEASQDADTSVKPPETTTPPDVTPAATTPESAAPHRALTEDDRNRLDEAVTAVIASMQSTLGIGKPTAEYDERGAVIRVEGKGGGASVGVRLASRAEIDDVRFNSDNRRAVYHSYVNAGDNTNRQGPPKGTGAHAGRYTLNEFLALSPAMAKKAVAGTTVPSFLVVSPTHQTTVMPSDAVIYLDKQTWANHPDSVAEEITHLATIGFATDSQMAAMAKELAAKGVISEATANNPPHALRLSSELHEALAAEISSEITMRRDAAAANRTFKKPGLSDAIAKTISPISTWVTNLIRKVFPTFRAVVKTEKASATQIQQFADGLLGGQVVDQTFVGPESTDHLEDTRRAAEVAQYEADVKKQSTADREVRRVASEARAKARQAEAKDNAIRTAVRKQDLAGYKVDAAKSKHAKAGEITAKEERLRAIIDEIAAANAERQTADGEDAGNANDDIAATVAALRLEREQLRQDIKVLRSQTGQSGAALGEIAAAKDATASGEDVKIKAGMTASTVFSTRKDNRAEQGLDPEQRDFERDNRLTLTPRTREDSRAEGQRILTGLADKAGVTPGSMAYDQTMLDMVRTRMAAMIDAEANGDSTAGASDTDIGTLQILMAYARNRVSRFSSGKSSGADQGNAGILADKLAKETALMSSMNASLMGRSFAMLNDGVMRPIDRLTHLRDLMSAPSEATAKKAKALYRAGKGDEAYELTKAEAVANFKASKKALEDRGWGIDDLFNDEPGAGAFFSTANGNRQFVGLAKDLMAHKLGFQFWRFLGGMYQNNLIGIVTQGITVTSNTAYLVTQMMGVKPLEAIIGSTLKARGKDWHGITMAGYAEMVNGMTNSGVWGRALSNMIGSVKEGHSLLEEKTVGRLRQAGLDVGEFDDPMHYNRFTKLFTLSRRLSTGMDEVFSTVWYEAHLRAEAYALANSKGVPAADRAAFIDKMVARPSPTLRDDAGKAAAKMVFRADFTQGGLTNLINNIRKQNTFVGFGAMLAIPFLHTLVRITKDTAKIAPITSIPTALYRIHRDSKRDGKFATKTAVEGGANVLFSAVLTMAVAGLTDDDDISGTGIPYSLEHQAEWEKEQRNLQSRTVRIPLTNRRIRLDYMAPLGLAITQAADIRNAISGKITWGAAFGNSWRSMIGEQYVQGVVKTLKAWGDGDPQSFDKWSKDTLAGFVPYAATQRDVDHGIRGATDAGDSKMLTKSLASDSVGVDQSAKMFARDVVRKGAPTIADVMFDKREVDVDLAGNADQGRLIRKPGSGVVLAWDKWLDEYNTVAAKKGDKRWYPPAIRAELPGDAGKMTEEQFAVADSTYAKLLSERLTDPTGVPFEAGYQRRLASIFTKARADARRIASVDGKH